MAQLIISAQLAAGASEEFIWNNPNLGVPGIIYGEFAGADFRRSEIDRVPACRDH
jgi:hypothetical protein